MPNRLLFLFLVTVLLLGSSGGALSLDATGTASSIRRSKGEVNVLLGVETDNERGDVDDLLADTDVPLPDQNTSVVNALGQTALEDLSLQAALQEIFDLEGQHVIETHAALVEHTNANETANQGVTLEKTLGVLGVELEELTSSTTNFGKDQSDTPDLALVAETIFTSEFQLSIEASRLEGTTGDFVSLAVVPRCPGHFWWES